jgi:hypothetical protein
VSYGSYLFFVAFIAAFKNSNCHFSSGQTKNGNTNNRYKRVGIKFVINTPGKLYPAGKGMQKYSGVVAQGCGKPPVMCKSTFL